MPIPINIEQMNSLIDQTYNQKSGTANSITPVIEGNFLKDFLAFQNSYFVGKSDTIAPEKGGTGIAGGYAAGDIIIATAANVLGRLPKGSNGQVLTLVAGLPAWSAASGGVPVLPAGSIPFSEGTTLTSSSDIIFDQSTRTLKIGHNTKNGKIYMIGDGTPFTIDSIGGNNIFRLYTGTTLVNRRVCVAFANPNTEWAVGINTSDGKFRIAQGADLGGDGSVALAIDKITRNVGVGTVSPNSSARLDVWSTTSGFAPPEMTATQASAISTTSRKLIIYVTDTNGTFTSAGLWLWTGTIWKLILAE